MTRDYLPEAKAPPRDEIDRMTGPVLVEFGTAWCGYCQAAQKDIVPLLAKHPDVRHVKVEDGPGRRLGRSFRVKLWPNLVFMNETHYSYLREELPGVRDHDDVTNIIGVDIALSDEALRPHVATVTFGGNHILSS